MTHWNTFSDSILTINVHNNENKRAFQVFEGLCFLIFKFIVRQVIIKKSKQKGLRTEKEKAQCSYKSPKRVLKIAVYGSL